MQLEQMMAKCFRDIDIRHEQSLESRVLVVEVRGSTRRVGRPTRRTSEPSYSTQHLQRCCSSAAEAAEV